MKRRTIPTAAAALAAMLFLSGCAGSSGDSVSVQSVAAINGMGSVGVNNRYAGIVVSGQTEEIRLDESMNLDELRVEEGQLVSAGDVLFTYNNEELLLTIEQNRIELEQLKNSVTTKNSQIDELKGERDRAPESEKLQYTLEIQSLEADIKETEYNITSKQKELDKLEATSVQTEVSASISGRVTAVNQDGGTDNMGNPLPFITIVETGNLRVKGTINELNRNSLTEGETLVVRSRTDDATWYGVLDSIDWENPQQNSGDSYYYYAGSDDEMTSSSKYPFYVSLDSYDGLFIGQHVYIEPAAAESAATGDVTLPAYFINDIDGAPWVWAANQNDKLEKRDVTLGDYDPFNDTYVVTGGITLDDYVAFPDDSLSAGMPVRRFDDLSSFDDMPADGDFGALPDDGGLDDFSADDISPEKFGDVE